MAGIVDIALSQEGTKEASGNNDVKYNDWYYGRHVSGGSYPWCAVFVSWCANQAGVPTSVIPKTASVSTLHSFFQGAGLFQPKGNGYKPKAGDILIQKSNGASHTGIVTGSSGGSFTTIEGNTSNGVYQRSYSLNDSKLTGFGTPNYSGAPLTGSGGNLIGDSTDNTGSGGSAGGSSLGVGSYDYTDYTVKKGDTIQSIANKYGTTPALIIFMNDLNGKDLKVGQVLKIPTAKNGVDNPASGVGSITKNLKHSMKVEVSHPTIEAIFFTETAMLATVSTTGLTSANDVDNDIISVNTVRNMSQDCPTMTISLVWRRGWYQALSSNDLVVVKMQRPPEKKVEVFWGLIDDIRKTLDFSSGNPQRAVQVTCRGFAKAFVNFDVGLIENISVEPETGFFAQLTELVKCDSYAAIELVYNAYVGKGIQYKFSDGKTLEDYLSYSGTHRENEKLMDYTSYTSYNGSLWNFIKELSNLPFNETFWELVDGKPNLIHRKTPFNKDEWTNLPRTTIGDYDIVSDNTGRSDLETYTVYQVNMSLLGEDTKNLYNPLWYPPYYNKYGITMLTVDTVYEAASY